MQLDTSHLWHHLIFITTLRSCITSIFCSRGNWGIKWITETHTSGKRIGHSVAALASSQGTLSQKGFILWVSLDSQRRHVNGTLIVTFTRYRLSKTRLCLVGLFFFHAFPSLEIQPQRTNLVLLRHQRWRNWHTHQWERTMWREYKMNYFLEWKLCTAEAIYHVVSSLKLSPCRLPARQKPCFSGFLSVI